MDQNKLSKNYNLYDSLGKKLKSIRKDFGYTQQELARVFGLSKQCVVNYENGTAYIPLDRIILFCKHFGIEIADIIKTGSIKEILHINSGQRRLSRDIYKIDNLVKKITKTHTENSKCIAELSQIMREVTDRKIVTRNMEY